MVFEMHAPAHKILLALGSSDTNVSQKLAATLDDILLVGGKVLLVQFQCFAIDTWKKCQC
jgi:hypothetical protein